VVAAGAFTKYSFARSLRAGDSRRFAVNLKEDRDEEIRSAVSCSRNPIELLDYFEREARGKRYYSYKDYSLTLVLRALGANIKYRTKTKMPSRDSIVRGVIQAVSDATPFSVHRRDISSFYENVPLNSLHDQLLNSPLLSPTARHVLEEFFNTHCNGSVTGLPRGVSLSAILAEVVMQPLDRVLRSHPDIYRYFRFSDDMLILTYRHDVDVDSILTDVLPTSFSLNPKKMDSLHFKNEKKASGFQTFDYLGYDFAISNKVDRDPPAPRAIAVSIADKKIRRFKSRLILSFKFLKKNGDAAIFMDRVRFLASNYTVSRTGINYRGRKKSVNSGVYFNYRLCRNADVSAGLPRYEDKLAELDRFVQFMAFSPNSEFSGVVASKLSYIRKADLRKISFAKGYAEPMMMRVRANRISRIKAVWAYGS